jgi:hypothetical protein
LVCTEVVLTSVQFLSLFFYLHILSLLHIPLTQRNSFTSSSRTSDPLFIHFIFTHPFVTTAALAF